MGSSHFTQSPSIEFLRHFNAVADAQGRMTFAQFMTMALYGDEVGYYMQDRRRVGRHFGMDFYTATSLGSLFGELVIQSCLDLLGSEACTRSSFIEIGAEPSGGVLHELTHPFATQRLIPIGQPIELSGPCIVFSNELFDAQPCRRFVHRPTGWQELGVMYRDGLLQETELPLPISPPYLPADAPIGYVLDAPEAAGELLRRIAMQPWQGLFLACDYGKSWQEISTACPCGTMRAYRQHRQSSDLTAFPGDQDLTCHVCWDWLTEGLTAAGFSGVKVQSQEAFFVRHAAHMLEQTARAEAARLSTRKMALMQLIHPAHLGQKFQVLHALRTE